MHRKKDLLDTWVLVKCGEKKFAVNSKFLNSMEDFKQAQCLKAVTMAGIKRGVYNIIDMDIIILDGRRLLGEESITSKKMEFSNTIHKMKCELLNWVDDVEWGILAGRKVNLEYTEQSFYKWLNVETDIKEINKIKKRILVSYRELYIMAENVLNERSILDSDIKKSISILEDIKYNIEKNIFKQLSRIIVAYNKSFSEVCIIMRHKGRTYGITVDSVIAVTEQVNAIPRYSEYKVIAGECDYKNEVYNIFNMTYITDLAKKLE